jgi:AbrB family looped-hinge helix DNA binding protein
MLQNFFQTHKKLSFFDQFPIQIVKKYNFVAKNPPRKPKQPSQLRSIFTKFPPMNNRMTLNENFQLTIPPNVREEMGLKPGMPFDVLMHNHHLELVPVPPIATMRGAFRGIDTTIHRDCGCV